MAPVDVPCWDFWLERYEPNEMFWELWSFNLNNEGAPFRDVEDLVDDALNGPLEDTTYKGGTILGQLGALRRLRLDQS
jgi:hypothetical protein